ncbi:MAG: chorismate synthase [Solobacterium sp.]|nr:chorismate synthase [Solobacterium sp.]
MKNTIGNEITVTVFGESHGPSIGCVIDGLPSGFRIDPEALRHDMNQRRAVGAISTGRSEADEVEVLSGLKDWVTEGTPVALMIRNTNVRKQDYDDIRYLARPGHADYAAERRYLGYQDASGGGHFSGRLTAPIVAAGSILRQMLEERGILIGTHIRSLFNIEDDPFLEHGLEDTIRLVNDKDFAVINDAAGAQMKQAIEQARTERNSLGGVLETAVIGVEAGIGEPIFEAVESRLASALFAVPAVKGVEFGAGFAIAGMTGQEANDRFTMFHGEVATITNHNGGINGGITNGMTILFRTAVKPTPSIAAPQFTVDFKTMENTSIEIKGRHDPAIVHRARAVVNAVTAIVLADMLASAHGRQWLGGK